jgi:hypothetical protein
MTDKFKTYVITDPTQTSFNFTLGPTGLTGYDGFLYLMMGTGGYGGNYPNITPPQGGGGGFINAGYVDLNYPYTVREINVGSSGSSTNLSIGYTGPNIDPTNGNTPFILKADEGQYKYLNAISGTSTELVSGFYSGANTFSTGPSLINQRGDSSEGQGASGPTGPRGFVNNDFGQGNGPTGILGGGGFYGGTVGPTGPFGFSSGGWYDTGASSGATGTLGYTVITLIPSSLAINTSFLTGSTGTIGNTGLYLYSLLGGGGGGYVGNGGGGGSGDIRNGFLNNSGSISYEIGAGGTPGATGGDITISTDGFTTALTAIGGESPGPNTGGKGFFAGGFNGSNPIEGQNYINLPSNFSITADGAGSVDISSYGQGVSSGGGGGGPYGGNYNGNGQGYGCGGGGQGSGYAGSGGYAILKQLIQNNFKYMNITSSTVILPPTFYSFTGVWGFMDAPSSMSQLNVSKSYFNTFHFLIKEDNVQRIDIVKDSNSYFATTISFSRLNNKVQQFKMTATDPSPYMSLVFYA